MDVFFPFYKIERSICRCVFVCERGRGPFMSWYKILQVAKSEFMHKDCVCACVWALPSVRVCVSIVLATNGPAYMWKCVLGRWRLTLDRWRGRGGNLVSRSHFSGCWEKMAPAPSSTLSPWRRRQRKKKKRKKEWLKSGNQAPIWQPHVQPLSVLMSNCNRPRIRANPPPQMLLAAQILRDEHARSTSWKRRKKKIKNKNLFCREGYFSNQTLNSVCLCQVFTDYNLCMCAVIEFFFFFAVWAVWDNGARCVFFYVNFYLSVCIMSSFVLLGCVCLCVCVCVCCKAFFLRESTILK